MFKKMFNAICSNVGKVGRAAQRGYASVKAMVVTGVATVAAVLAPMAFAVPPDFTALTSGIDLSTVQSASLTALVALLGLYLIISGGKTIVGFFRGR